MAPAHVAGGVVLLVALWFAAPIAADRSTASDPACGQTEDGEHGLRSVCR